MDLQRLACVALAGLLGLAVAIGGGASQAAGAKRKHRSACQRLAQRHKDIAPSRKLVTVVRGDDERGRISACVLPRGKLRTLASWDDGLSREWGRVRATAGTWVLVEQGYGDQYGGMSRSLTRVDVREGRRLGLSGYGCMTDFGHNCPDGTDFGEFVLAAGGAGAYERSDLASATTALMAFAPAGTMTQLADGPVDELRIAGGQITWTQGGVAHAAPLPR
jgi:hypothetical protein